ncbi:MAG: hypothetical protein AAB930_02240, partial [Patescibacteria group bacterium]
MMKYKVGIVGVGMVGGPLKKWFEDKAYEHGRNLFLYDKDPAKRFSDDINSVYFNIDILNI